jgi:hypothetical protein
VDTFIVCVFTVDDIVPCVDGIALCVDIAEFAWPIFLDVNFEIPFVTKYIPGLVEDVEIFFVSKVAVFATVKLCNEDMDAICSWPCKFSNIHAEGNTIHTSDNIIHSKYTDNECIHK